MEVHGGRRLLRCRANELRISYHLSATKLVSAPVIPFFAVFLDRVRRDRKPWCSAGLLAGGNVDCVFVLPAWEVLGATSMAGPETGATRGYMTLRANLRRQSNCAGANWITVLPVNIFCGFDPLGAHPVEKRLSSKPNAPGTGGEAAAGGRPLRCLVRLRPSL
jgi:hypothetical protein